VRPLLLDVARLLDRAPRRLIASGLLRHEADEVVEAFAAHGLRERDRRFGGEWAAVLLER
jgi:ribosomal protein L11 methylase PrmA